MINQKLQFAYFISCNHPHNHLYYIKHLDECLKDVSGCQFTNQDPVYCKNFQKSEEKKEDEKIYINLDFQGLRRRGNGTENYF